MERKIGEIFEYNGEWYQCVEQPDYIGYVCKVCSFSGIGNCELDRCSGIYRSDKKSVIFKKLEKVGEPYKFQKRTIQIYKLYTEPFISVDMDFIQAYVKGSNTIDIIIKQDIEDMEEKKLNLKPFDIEAAKAGKPVCTRDGRKARIICFDLNTCSPYSVIAAVTNNSGYEEITAYMEDGYYLRQNEESSHDLMMLPEKRSGWAIIRKSEFTKPRSKLKRCYLILELE